MTHSLCTLEFADHRPLYDWLIEQPAGPGAAPAVRVRQACNLSHAVLSKRRLTRLVAEGHVRGWDDPRLPTLSGLRRRVVPPEALRDFVARLSVSRNEGTVEIAMLEHAIRNG